MSLNAMASEITGGEISVSRPSPAFALWVHVEHRRTRFDHEHVVPSVTRVVRREVHHGRTVFLGRVVRLRQIDLVGLLEGRPVVDPVGHRHVHDAVVIEVAGSHRPAVVVVLDVLGAEPRRDFFRWRDSRVQVFDGQVSEADFAGAAHVERNWTEVAALAVGRDHHAVRAVDVAGRTVGVHAEAEDVGIDQRFEFIPVVRLEGVRRRCREHRGEWLLGRRRGTTAATPTARAARIRRRRGRGDAGTGQRPCA